MPDRTYIHGYSSEEQQHLAQQAHYGAQLLALGDLNYRQAESLLEIGCAAGATLGVLGTAFPRS
jgi:cyclopropane fatty-acyl-phospholipid synthase-like methyltransferase